MKKIAMVLVGFVISFFATGEDLAGKVVKVIDGNTIEVMTADNESYKIMLHGIDCPEIGQEYGDKARKFLEKMILEKAVSVIVQGKDRLGVRQAVVLINGQIDPRYELLEAGLAWTSERQPIEDLESVREKAKEKGKGLWKDQDPTPPWTYRRQQTMLQPKTS